MRELAAVVTSFAGGLGAHRREGALKERVINNVALVVFPLDDPVAGKDLALADVGEEDGGVLALFCFYEKRSAGAKGLQLSLLGGVVLPTMSISAPRP